MPHDSSSEPYPDDADAEFVEIDPSGRYGRYKEVLGKGAFKKVYRAFDELEGIEVAWNQVKVADLLRNFEDVDQLYSEVNLLKTLKHKNIIKFYNSWVDTKGDNINFITEIFTSGTLRQYRKKHKHVDLRALKKWSRQILEGLFYLHSHNPPVIHRDLKCDNILVNGNQGEVKIGDLGLAAILYQARSAHSVIGTPEFMAPEFYEEEYNELVDIYAFGMCLLELVTFEYPYAECANAAQIYKKVTSGIKPAALAKVNDPGVRAFIEKCIANVSDRLPAKDLLMDPFLQFDEDSEIISQPLPPNADNRDLKDPVPEGSRDFYVEGQRTDLDTIFLKLRIADSTGHFRNIRFPFHTESDTPLTVASEMVLELDLTDQDVSTIASMIESEIRSYIPDWTPTELSVNDVSNQFAVSAISCSEAENNDSPSQNDCPTPSVNFVLERLPSGRIYWSDTPKEVDGNSPIRSDLLNLSLEDSPSTGHTGIGENEQSPSGVRHEDSDYVSLEPQEDEHMVPDNFNRKESIYKNKSNSDRDFPFTYGPCALGENNGTLSDVDLDDDVRITVEKLEPLLIEQKQELDELKRKHELAVLDLLKETPPAIRHQVLRICKLKISDNKMHS